MNHAWLDRFVPMNGHEVSILERLKSDALTVRGDFFFFAQDRIDQGVFTGTQPIALYCGKDEVKVANSTMDTKSLSREEHVERVD